MEQLIINHSIPKNIDNQIADAKYRLFSVDFVEQRDTDGEFPTNGDRFGAQEVKKRNDKEAFTAKGFLCQLLAAGWHFKSAAQLKQIGDTVGRDRIQVLHGTVDRMITVAHAYVLIDELGGKDSALSYTIFEGAGHVLGWEKRQEHNKLIADLVEKTKKMDKE